jgi:hypothetical protein
MMRPQVVRVFSIENLFKEMGGYGMFVSVVLFGALPDERFPHLKRKVNLFSSFDYLSTRVSFASFILLFLVSGY